jgi:DNA-directed RNA polymerase subunit alpha
MHVRWRGLELPAQVTLDEKSRTETFGRFIVEPFERGFGTTVGNSLRRILLSSIEGAAVVSASIEGVQHEFSTIPGVIEDVVDIILNIKGLVVSLDSDEPKTMRLAATGPGEVTADLIEADTAVTIHNPEHVIATLTDEVDFEAELRVAKGRGYQPATEQIAQQEEEVIGEIPIDALFSPVRRVRYRVEDTRIGHKTNYDRLILDIWTDGTLTPEMALVEAAKILRKHLNPFVQYFDLGVDRVSAEASAAASVDEELMRKLEMPIAELDLSVRAGNCLESADIRSVGELVQKDEPELLAVRSFGKTSLREVKRKLDELGLTLGMTLPETHRDQVRPPHIQTDLGTGLTLESELESDDESTDESEPETDMEPEPEAGAAPDSETELKSTMESQIHTQEEEPPVA